MTFYDYDAESVGDDYGHGWNRAIKIVTLLERRSLDGWKLHTITHAGSSDDIYIFERPSRHLERTSVSFGNDVDENDEVVDKLIADGWVDGGNLKDGRPVFVRKRRP